MIGILIVSHGAFGESLIQSASHVLGSVPLLLRQLGVTRNDDPDDVLRARRAARLPRPGRRRAGAHRHLRRHARQHRRAPARGGRVEGVAGVNLPMLIRALTYRNGSLPGAVQGRSPAAPKAWCT